MRTKARVRIVKPCPPWCAFGHEPDHARAEAKHWFYGDASTRYHLGQEYGDVPHNEGAWIRWAGEESTRTGTKIFVDFYSTTDWYFSPPEAHQVAHVLRRAGAVAAWAVSNSMPGFGRPA